MVAALSAALVTSASPLAAQEGDPSPAPADTVPRPDSLALPVPLPGDTLVADTVVAGDSAAVADSLPRGPVVVIEPISAEVPDTVPGLRLGLGRIGYVWPIDLESALGVARPDARQPGQSVDEWMAARLADDEMRRSARRDTLAMIFSSLDRLPRGFDRRRFLGFRDALPTVDGDDAQPRGQQQNVDLIPDALAGIADLDLQIDGTGQIGSQWQSFDPCTLGAGQRCNASALPTIKPDFQLRAIVKGTISERVHLDVDFDQTREFDATNNLNVFYQGKSGEILEFAEVGEVSLPLPPSQFISSRIPAGNFGLRAESRFGPLTLKGVLAEQDGSVESRRLTLDIGGAEQGVLQEFETVIDDAGYTSGQFFWVVDPRDLPGYPVIDATALSPGDAPTAFRPVSALKLYRHEEQSGSPQNVEEGVIQARAIAPRPAAADPTLPDSAEFQGFFKPLVEGEDFIVHDSGLWIVLKSRTLDPDALAVSYITAAGDTVGDYNAEEIFRNIANSGSGVLPQLGLLRDPATHRPGGVTWEKEMHQVYRISSSDDVESNSIDLTISQGPIESGPIVRQLDGADFTFLQIFGLDDEPTDDRLDAGRVWRPDASGGLGVVTGAYLVFPTLEPFRAPPPIAALGEQPFPLAAGDLNLEMYEEPIDQLRRSSFRYRLNLVYRARSSGRASSFSLGAIGIREGSEKVTIDGRQLERGSDYTIDYEIGQLQILRPTELFGSSQSPSLDVRFEQKPIFQVQQTSILGLTGEYSLGDMGSIDFIGLLQREGSVLNRPELGLEPGAVSLGGIIADLEFQPRVLDSFVNSLPGISTSLPSTVRFEGELAGSSPTTNRNGLTYVDDFEGSSRLRVGLGTRAWRNGSVVSRPEADGDDFLPDNPSLANQLSVVWQAQWQVDGGAIQGPLPTVQIDPAINTLNPASTEEVLWVSITDPPAGENGWYSITQSLSETGLDLTAIEFLEFYALTLNSTSDRISMIIDIGTVSEDALVADSLGISSGVGLLDQEADPLVGVWGNQDDTGLWDTGCVAEQSATAYPLGDLRANCTNNNGVEDTEDLNRDNFLNQDERYFRFIVPLNSPSRYLDRQTGGQLPFSKYRIPLALPDLLQNATSDARQNVKHIRITFTSDRAETVLISRMEFSGSPWLKRAGSGSVSGFTGQNAGTAGQVAVGPISTTDGGYVSPPGISDQQAQSTDDLTFGAQPINEQSLRLLFEDVPAGERIEVFRRFTERPRNFLLYRQMRAWALPVAGDFGETTDLRFYLRLGFDTENFYLYRSPLQNSAGATPAREDWLPERLVDFDRWIELRAEAEKRILDVGTTLPPDSSIIVWDVDVFADGDSTHAVVISDRSRAPNLAAIREMAMGVENAGGTAASAGEIWIDDLRLAAAPDQGGAAMRAGVNVNLADIARFDASLSHQNPFYRQLGTDPSYQSSSSLTSRAHVEAGRFLPNELGLAMPFDLQYLSDRSDPFFTREADVLAERIPNLRTPKNAAMSWNVGLFKRTASGSPILRSTIDGLRLSYSRSSTNQTATQSETDGASWSAAATWSRSVTDLSLPLLPGLLRGVIDGLPDFLSNSTILRNLKDLRFRYTPRDLNFGANLSSSNVERRRFTSSIRGSEPAVEPTIDRQRTLAPRAGFVLQPFPSLVAGYTVSNVRDLVDPSFRLTSPAGVQALEDERRSFLGAGVGWEMARTTNTNLTYQPEVASWFDPRFTLATTYQSNRNASYVVPTEGSDTTLVRDLRLARNVALDVDVQPVNFLSVLGVPQARDAEGFARTVRAAWDRLRPIRLAWTRNAEASYDRRDLESSFKDQLVLDSFDRLRFLTPRDTASSASNSRRFSVGGGVRLPANLDAELDYSVRQSNTFTQRSVRTTDETEWPSVRLRWRSVPVPSFLDGRVRSMSLTAGLRILDRATTTGTGQDQGSESLTRSLALTFVFTNGFNLSYELSNTRNDRTDGTGFSRSNRNSHSIRGTGTVAAPGFVSFVRNPVRLSAEFTLNGNADCRELGGSGFGPSALLVGGDGCVAHVDQATNNLSLTADTDFSGYGIGVQLLWVHRASAVGTRQSSDQYNFNIFGRFYLRSQTAELPPP